MPRRRLGVALLLPAPVSAEIDGLRRALGEPELDRIPPHVTLVPPVNVREELVDEAARVLRTAAASVSSSALRLTLGPPATFLPDNPVVYLPVGGDVDRLRALRDAVFVPPLERRLTWPFVPHVTLADGIDPSLVARAPEVLGSYLRDGVVVDSVHLLEEGEGHRWSPIAAARLGPAAVVGRGGLPLSLSVTDRLDDPVRRWLSVEWADPQRPLAVTARRDADVVGAAAGWTDGALANLSELFVAADVRREGVGGHVVAAFLSAAAERGAVRCRLRCAAGSDVERFYSDRGWRREAVYPGPSVGEDVAQLVRDL